MMDTHIKEIACLRVFHSLFKAVSCDKVYLKN